MQHKKLFWLIFISLSLLSQVILPLVWGLAATIPLALLAWWIVYHSDWF